MKFKLCRIFNVKITIPCLVDFLLMTAFVALFNKESMATVSTAFWLIVVFLLIWLYYCPSHFEIDDRKITILGLYKKYFPRISFVIVRGGAPRLRLATVTVSHITKIEYKANLFERLFGVGRIIVYGRVELTRKNAEPVDDDDGTLFKFHKIYGIKHFKTVKEEIKQAFYGVEHIEI